MRDRLLAEVCDDRDRADRLVPTPTTQNWREWEGELVDGGLPLGLGAVDTGSRRRV